MRRALATALVGAALLTPVVTAPPATARPNGVMCITDMGFWLFHGSRRTICDTDRAPDGSWTRFREFWTPAHSVPLTCSTFGGSYYSSTSCTGGYWQPRTSNGVETYPVTDATVLGDEPGWIP